MYKIIELSPVKRFAAWAGLYSASAAFQKLAGFFIFLWLARVLPVTEYAKLGLLYAVQTGIVTFGIAGVFESVVGSLRTHPEPEERRALYGAANRAFLVMTVTASAFYLLAFLFLERTGSISLGALMWVVASGALLAFASYQGQLVRLEERHSAAVLFNTLPPLGGFLGGLVSFIFLRTVEAFFMGSAMGAGAAIVLLVRQRQPSLYKQTAPVTTRLLLVTGAPFVAVAVLGWLSGYGQNYIVDIFFPPIEVARFTFALTLSSVMQLVATALNQVWSPRFYQITHQEPIEAVERRNRRFFTIQAVALGVVGAGLVIMYAFVRRMVGGHLIQYGSMRFELALLAGAYVLLPPWWHCQNYFLAYGKGPELMKNVIITSTVGLALWVLLMWRFGPPGIYIGFMVQMFVRTQGAVILARRHWPLRLAWEGVAAGLFVMMVGVFLSTFK